MKNYTITKVNKFQFGMILMKSCFKRGFSVVVVLAILIFLMPLGVMAEDAKINANSQSFYSVGPSFSMYGGTTWSYLLNNDDETISLINATSSSFEIETYDKNYNLVSEKNIPIELSEYGVFYSGEQYNYIAFGDGDFEENNEKEVIRIVRYDKHFNRIDSVSIKGGESYTIRPFEFSAGRMSEHGNELVLHTSRLR